jgi:hypothetical protein
MFGLWNFRQAEWKTKSCSNERVRPANVSDMAEARPVLLKTDFEITKIKDSHRSPSKRSEIPKGLQ